MALNIPLGLEDAGVLLSGPCFLTGDPMGPPLDHDEALSPSSSLEGRPPPSPPLSFSSCVSSSPYPSLSSYSSSSPPPSPLPFPSLLGDKAGTEDVPFPWLSASELLDAHVRADHDKDDAFSGMDWMTEKIDLSDFDLESLIGSCSSDEPPSSPEELLASLDNHLDLDAFETAPPAALHLGLPLPDLPPLPLALPLASGSQPRVEAPPPDALKSEPPSPVPSPAYALELGSEVDVLVVGEASPAVTPAATPRSPVVLALSPPGRLVMVLTATGEAPALPAPGPAAAYRHASSDCDSDSGIESGRSPPQSSPSASPAAGSSRTKPYSKPDSSSKSPKVKSVSGAPKVVEKKLKKMEQNKTAATRYRQKKRVEQEVLLDECVDLERRNRELGEKADSISREIQYLKDLMEEVRSAKNRRSKAGSGV